MGSISDAKKAMDALIVSAAAATQSVDQLTAALIKTAEAGQSASSSWQAVTLQLTEYVKQVGLAKEAFGQYGDAVEEALGKMEKLSAFAAGSFAESFTRDITNRFKEGKLSVQEYRKELEQAFLKMQEMAASGGMGKQGMDDLNGQMQELQRILAELERAQGR